MSFLVSWSRGTFISWSELESDWIAEVKGIHHTDLDERQALTISLDDARI
jgi:hypothetical protein